MKYNRSKIYTWLDYLYFTVKRHRVRTHRDLRLLKFVEKYIHSYIKMDIKDDLVNRKISKHSGNIEDLYISVPKYNVYRRGPNSEQKNERNTI